MAAESPHDPHRAERETEPTAAPEGAPQARTAPAAKAAHGASPASAPAHPDELAPYSAALEKGLDAMSPFEVKDLLISYARSDAKKKAIAFLNAGRGNPNWICTVPRDAFFCLGRFAMSEARRTSSEPAAGLAGEPSEVGTAERFLAFLDAEGAADEPSEREAARFLKRGFDYLTAPVPEGLGLAPDALVHEWTEGIVGCEYPVPDRILGATQEILRRYLVQEMDGGECEAGRPSVPVGQSAPYDLFATEGGTAAMCYLFYSLKANFLVNPGDRIALMTPIFTPYIDIAALDDFHFDVTRVNASAMTADGLHAWQYPDEELDKLRDPSIKLLCLVNPSNPPSYALDERSRKRLVDIVKHDNPELIIVTDDVYGTFVPGFRSIMHDLPYNTALVYSFSKYFGATGWRLAAIALAHENVFDARIAKLPHDERQVLLERYRELKEDGAALRFCDRLVADSRLVALNGTAGLSTPQQVQMSLFALHALLDAKDAGGAYKSRMREVVGERLGALWRSLGWTLEPDPLRAGYYSMLDLEIWCTRIYGAAFFAWLKARYRPIDVVLRLARDTGVVVLAGDGFDARKWSIRVALANLDADDFTMLGGRIAQILDEYHRAWQDEAAS